MSTTVAWCLGFASGFGIGASLVYAEWGRHLRKRSVELNAEIARLEELYVDALRGMQQ